MKPSLVILVAAAALLAAVAGSSRLAAAPASASPAARSACGPITLPRASSAGQQSLYGRIRSLARRGRRYELRFDPAFVLTGVTASRAALEDTGSSDVPNDSYVVDESHRLLTYLVPAAAQVSVLRHGTCTTRTTVARLARSIPKAGFWIRLRGDTVDSIDQQYHP